MSIGVALLGCASKRVATFMILCIGCDEHGPSSNVSSVSVCSEGLSSSSCWLKYFK